MATVSATWAAYRLAQQARNLSRNYLALLDLTRDYWLKKHGDGDVAAVGPDECREFILWLSEQTTAHGKPMASSSVDVHYRNLRAFFTWAAEEEVIAKSPMKKVKRPRVVEKMPDVLSEVEVVRLLERVKSNADRNAYRDYTIHLMFVTTGLRLDELAGLTVDRVNLEAGTARVLGKGRIERDVPLELDVRRAISMYMLKHRKPVAGETALFLNEYGTAFQRQGIRTMVVRDLEKHVPRKLSKYGPHTLRHTFATLNLRATRDLKSTSRIMGHKTSEVTDRRYTHLTVADVARNAQENPVSNWLSRVGGG